MPGPQYENGTILSKGIAAIEAIRTLAVCSPVTPDKFFKFTSRCRNLKAPALLRPQNMRARTRGETKKIEGHAPGKPRYAKTIRHMRHAMRNPRSFMAGGSVWEGAGSALTWSLTSLMGSIGSPPGNFKLVGGIR